MCSAINIGRSRKCFGVRGAQASSWRPPRPHVAEGSSRGGAQGAQGAQEAKWRTFRVAENKMNRRAIRRATV